MNRQNNNNNNLLFVRQKDLRHAKSKRVICLSFELSIFFFFLVESSYGFYYLWDKAVYISKGMIKKNNQFLQLSMSLCLIIYSFDLDK